MARRTEQNEPKRANYFSFNLKRKLKQTVVGTVERWIDEYKRIVKWLVYPLLNLGKLNENVV